MAYPECGSEQPAPPYDNLRAVDWTRLLAEKSQALDHWFFESVQPFVDARCKLLEYYGKVQITVGPSGTKVFHTLPQEVQKLDDELNEAIEWLRQRFNHPANPTLEHPPRLGGGSAPSGCSNS